jgi:hypothetical protein
MLDVTLTRRVCDDGYLRGAVSSIIKCSDHNEIVAEFLQARYVGLSREWM